MNCDTHPSLNLFAAYQRMLRKRLRYFLSDLHPLLYADVVSALQEKGKLLSRSHRKVANTTFAPPSGIWSLLTLLIALLISPQHNLLLISSVSVAVEFFICALDLLDDIEDEDQTRIVRDLGPARVLNVSTTLLALAQRAILSLSQLEVAPELITRLLNTLQEVTLTATTGQHRDIQAEQRPVQDLTYEECIEIATQKAGSLTSLACRLGALCAGANDDVCQQFSELGKLLGIAHQLDNDCHDLYYLLHREDAITLSTNTEKNTRTKTDLVRGKKTLPIVLAAKVE